MKTVKMYLESNGTLLNLLQSTVDDKKIHPITFSDSKFPYLIYNVTPFTKDVAKTQNRVDLRVISDKFPDLEPIQNELMKMFHLERYPGFILNGKKIYSSKLSGSGKGKDPDSGLYEYNLVFNMISN